MYPHKGIIYWSCVGGFIPLKNNINDIDYDRILELWNINEPYWISAQQ